MPRGEYLSFPMIVDNVVIGLITATADIIERFNIPDAVVQFELPGTTRTRKAYERRVYSNANDITAEATTNVERVVKAYVPEKNRVNTGKKIKVPTGLRSIPASATGAAASGANAGNPRLATFNFPHGASNYQVARWITVNIPAARRPAYFITPAGAKKRTNVAALPAQTAGETTTPTTPTTP